MDRSASLVIVLELAATAYLCGLIWTIQTVHYPSLAAWPTAEFRRWHARHTRVMVAIVAPSMVGEAALAVARVLPGGRGGWDAWLGLLLVLTIWGSTAFVQVPCHRRLETGRDPAVIERLVTTNWIRTIAWTLRAILVGCAALATES